MPLSARRTGEQVARHERCWYSKAVPLRKDTAKGRARGASAIEVRTASPREGGVSYIKTKRADREIGAAGREAAPEQFLAAPHPSFRLNRQMRRHWATAGP